MPSSVPFPINPPPGVIKTESNRVEEGRYTSATNMRFRRGRAEKRGGWTRAVTTPTSGAPRAIHAWRDNSSNNYMAAGTYRKLYVYDTLWAQSDITPYRTTGTYANDPLTTSTGTPTVSVAHIAHGVSVGDTVIIAGSTAVGGITPNGTFVVVTVTNVNAFTYTFTSNASSTATGGGAAVTYKYEIPIGTEYGAYGAGWGVSTWGTGTWGSAHTVTSGIYIEPRVWALEHFGQLLLASYNGGAVYSFDPTASQPWGRASIIADAPTDCRSIVVTPERFVFALRSGMVVSSCSQGDYTTWTPASSNTAFSRTLTEGTKLVAGRVLGPFVTLVWTDGALYLFQYDGSQFLYKSSLAGRDCGLLAPNAAVTVDGVAYWMGPDNFWMYNGSVTKMPNVEDIRRYVFDDLNQGSSSQAAAVFNPRFGEIEFFYTGLTGTNPNKSVIYSIEDHCWTPQTVARCSGTHFTQGDTRPYMGTADGYIYQHENGADDNGAALPWSLTLAPYAMSEGMTNMLIDGIVFDFFNQAGSVSVTINMYDRLNDASPMDTQTQTVTLTAGITDFRLCGRYASMTLSGGTGIGDTIRMGKPVAFIRPSGKRS